MKLNYRDRIVLTVVIVVLVWVAGVMLFIKPAIENLQASQAALDDAKAQRSDLQDIVDADADLPERIVVAYREVTEMTESFYSVQETQVASQLVDDLLDEDEIVNLNMNISDYTIYTLNPYVYMSNRPMSEIDEDVLKYKNEAPVTAEDAMAAGGEGEAETAAPAATDNGRVPPAAATIGSYSITFSFTGKLDDVEKFCDRLQTSNDQKTMVVNGLTYSYAIVVKQGKDDEPDERELSTTDVEGEMELTMMVVEKLPDPNTIA